MEILVIDREEVRQLLPMRDCIEILRQAFRELCSGGAVQPLRTATWLPDKTGLLGLMPGYLRSPEAFGLKVVSVFPENHTKGFDSHQGAVLLFDTSTGQLLAVIDAAEITAIRTAAASAVATDLLARRDARDLAILGSGVQATTHLEAMCCVRDIKKVRVWSRRIESAKRFAAKHTQREALPIEPFAEPFTAVSGADIVCTVTASTDPVLQREWLGPGVHINAVGSSDKRSRELDSAAVAAARLFVDWRESTLNESGDFLAPLSEGLIGEDHIKGDIGELLLGRVEGRRNEQEITLFKSLGLAVEDLAAAIHVYQEALAENLGSRVPFGGPAHSSD